MKMAGHQSIVMSMALTLSLFIHLASGIESTVNTTSGVVVGKSLVFRGKNLLEFFLIPYAEPPVGDLRFKPPQPKTRETTPIDGAKEGYVRCPQYPGTMELDHFRIGLVNQTATHDENCLYLDIYTPESAEYDNPIPVMVWIHGGGYVLGAGRYASGRVLASDYNVVVVTINYRLGALGFLNTEDENAVGDFGLRDQMAALKWVQQNIRNFGGDPERVTIAGESAGAGSVAQLLISPASEGLFKRAIIESGALVGPWVCVKNPKQYAIALAEKLNCTTTTTTALIECLRSKSAQAILHAQGGLAFVPVCSGGVMPFSQHELENSEMESDVAKRFGKIDILIGNNNQEGGLFFDIFGQKLADTNGGLSEENAENLTVIVLQSNGVSASTAQDILPLIRFIYSDWERPDSAIARTEKMVDLMTDLDFVPYTIQFARLHSKINLKPENRGNLYLYLLTHRPSWMTEKQWRHGADHGDDLFLVFGNPVEYASLNASHEDIIVSQTMMTYWTNFMRTGNPNPAVQTTSFVTWPPFELENEKYLVLDSTMNNMSVREKMFAERVTFWNEYYPAELKRLEKISNIKGQPCTSAKTSASGGSGTKTTSGPHTSGGAGANISVRFLIITGLLALLLFIC